MWFTDREEGKLRAIAHGDPELHVLGRPQLVGTTSIEHSDDFPPGCMPNLCAGCFQ